MLRKLYLIISVLIIAFALAGAQQNVSEKYLQVRGISEFEMKPLSRATATLFEGNNKISSVQTGSDGSFSFKLDINKQYIIHIEKDGLISKCISFNTQMPDEEKGTWMSEFSVGLFKPCAGMDYSLLKQPVDHVKFDAKRREYVSDKDYVTSIRPKMEQLMIKTDQCLLESYEAFVKKADEAARQNNFDEAVNAYKEALKIYPTEAYPSKRISEINNTVQRQQLSAEVYKSVIAEADALQNQGRNLEALQKYEKAASLNPSESYPKQRINEIKSEIEKQQAIKAEQQLKDDKFNQAMAKASVAYTRKDYAAAKQYYQEALDVKPGEPLPKTRMQEIQVIESKKAADDAARSEELARKSAFDKEYQGIVNQADQLFREKKYEEAKALYARAMTMKPAESYPSQRVKVIENAVAAEQAAIAKTKEDRYNAAMTAANSALGKSQFELAKQSFSEALTLKPDDPEAKKGIAEADRLADESAKLKIIEEQYTQTVSSGDIYIVQKKWNEAGEMFNKALVLKPGDKYAQTKLTLIANSLAADKAAKNKAIEDEYKSLIASSGNAISQKMYKQAREDLQKALGLKPGDSYATSRIAEIDKLETDEQKKTEQAQKLARQYQELIGNGDRLYADKDYSGARNSYVGALQIKPGDQYAAQKITSIDNLLLAEQVARQKQSENAFAEAMNKGNSLLLAKNYDGAKEAYTQALNIKPGDNNAKSKIGEIDLLIRQEEERLLGEQAQKKKYNDAVASADKYFNQGEFFSAKSYYQQASDMMPGESYPRQKLNETNEAILKQEKLLTEIKARDNAYNLALVNADKFYRAKDYYQARDEYSRASSLKPEEAFPKTRMAEMEALIAAREKEMAEAKARTDAYTDAMNIANDAFSAKKYAAARESYVVALTHRPGDALATDQIEKIDYLLAEAEKIRINEQAKKTAVDALLKTGDNLFDQARYSDAKTDYKKVLAMDPGNAYAKQRITRIDEINKLLSQDPAKSNQQAVHSSQKTIAAIPMGELKFTNESEKQLYLAELMKKYPSGITLEKYLEKYKETFRYIVIRNNEAQEFRHIRFTTFNGDQYSFNGKPITQQYFNSQTKVREGENYKEIVMQ